jgi:hypothetical protein
MAAQKLIAMADQLADANAKLRELQGAATVFGCSEFARRLQAERTEIAEIGAALRRLAEGAEPVERAEAESRALSLAGEINARLPELHATAAGDTVEIAPCTLAVAEMLASRLWVAQMLDPIAMAFGRRESTS